MFDHPERRPWLEELNAEQQAGVTHARSLGLGPGFGVLDSGDAADVLD